MMSMMEAVRLGMQSFVAVGLVWSNLGMSHTLRGYNVIEGRYRTRAGAFVIGVPNNLAQRFDSHAQAIEAYHRARRAG
jgi:hypothetical protein